MGGYLTKTFPNITFAKEPFIKTFCGVKSLTEGCIIMAFIDMILVGVGLIVMMTTEILSPDNNLSMWCALGIMIGIFAVHNSLLLIIAVFRNIPYAIAVWASSKVLFTGYDIFKWLYVDINYPNYLWLHIDALHPGFMYIFTCVKIGMFVYEMLIVGNYILEERSKCQSGVNPPIVHAAPSTRSNMPREAVRTPDASATAGPSSSPLISWLPFGK